MLLDQLHRLGAVLRLGHDLQFGPGFREARAQLFAHQALVVGDHGARGRRAARAHAAIVASSAVWAT